MNPKYIAGKSEHSQQTAFFCYVNAVMIFGFNAADKWCNGKALPECPSEDNYAFRDLEWMHSIPNGEGRGDALGEDATKAEKARARKTAYIRGNKLKAEGQTKGVHDVSWPYPQYPWHGLYMEFKKPSLRPKRVGAKGGMKDEQLRFRDFLIRMNYRTVVVYDWTEAVYYLKQYLGLVK